MKRSTPVSRDRLFLPLILLASVLLRFVDYPSRWGLAYDQAHDALLSRFALAAHKLPLLGPFSSAGPFQTGGEWYWFIMAGTFLGRGELIAPWVAMTCLSVLFVFMIYMVGREMESPRLGLIAGALAAVSTAAIGQSVNLTNQSPLGLCALGVIWAGIRWGKTRQARYLFLTGFLIALSASIHLEGAALLFTLPVLVLLWGFPGTTATALFLVGFTLPLLPLVLFDLLHQFINVRGFIGYYTVGQYRVTYEMLGRRWLTYLVSFWPGEWGLITGGNKWVGMALMGGVGVSAAVSALRRDLPKYWGYILGSLLLFILSLRYVRTPLFSSYLVFAHPFVILASAWVLSRLIRWQKSLGVAITAAVVMLSVWASVQQIAKASNFTAIQTGGWANKLITDYPGKTFAVYDFKYKTVGVSAPLALYLDASGKLSADGLAMGVGIATYSGRFKRPVAAGEELGYQVVDLTSSTSAELSRAGWIPVTAESVYRATEEWKK
ncbi:glycosyltransferase family 39 protein [Patescibacteria group bacterium]|nr:glycosyltransferase family 39 protein [Patescibacteria group bacterium]